MSKAEQIYRNVLDAMQEAEEIEGIENSFEYLKLMTAIRLEAKKRFDNCAERLDEEVGV